MPVIKRYSNRKLYDSDAGRYVTLTEIGELIREGEEVKVVDHDTGEDLTSPTLAQIIFEQEKRLGGILPEVVLTRLIRTGSSTLQSLQDNIRAFLDPVQHAENEIQRRVKLLVKEGKLSEAEALTLNKILLDPSLRETMAVLNLEQINPEDLVSREDLERLLHQVSILEKELESLQQR